MNVPHGLTREQLLELYYFMRLTRVLDERLAVLKRQGHLVGGVYRSLGQEADAVGSAYALDRSRGDVLCPLIRNLGSLLVQGGRPLEVLRQNLGRGTAPSGGRELGFHYADLERGFIGHIANLGNMVSVMAGVALKFRITGEPRVALVYSGDGATSTGAFHEGLNFAAVQRVPLVVIVEYNHYAYSTPAARQYAVKDLADRAAAYGVPSTIADGNDVLETYGVTRGAVDRARNGGGVTLIELKTYRRTGHAEHDPQRYVPEGEVERWAAENDPIDRYRRWLTAEPGWLKIGELDAVDDRVRAEIDSATDQALSEPVADPETAVGGVLAETGPHPHLWFRRIP